MTDADLFKKTIEKWGAAVQVTTAMEECGELIAALNQHFFRGRIPVETLAQEIADVELVCKQLRVLIGDALVDAAFVAKRNRLEEKLKG